MKFYENNEVMDASQRIGEVMDTNLVLISVSGSNEGIGSPRSADTV